MSIPQVDPQAIARNYLAVWNEADQALRLPSLESNLSPTVRYADPLMSGETPIGIANMI